jgi:hypothetical protein
VKDGYLQARQGLPGGVSYYQLTAKGTNLLGLSVSRSTPFGQQALQTHIALLWYCCMSETRRYRLEEDVLKRLFKTEPPPGDHCLEQGPTLRIYRAYAPGPHTIVNNVVRQLRDLFDAAMTRPIVRKWVDARQYRFVIFTETDERRRALRDAIKRTCDEQGVLASQAPISVEAVPGLRTIKEAVSHATQLQKNVNGGN